MVLLLAIAIGSKKMKKTKKKIDMNIKMKIIEVLGFFKCLQLIKERSYLVIKPLLKVIL